MRSSPGLRGKVGPLEAPGFTGLWTSGALQSVYNLNLAHLSSLLGVLVGHFNWFDPCAV